MAGIIRRFLTNAILCVFATDTRTRRAYAEFIRNLKVNKTSQEDFDFDGVQIESKFLNHVTKLKEGANALYIANLLSTPNQWAVPASDIPGFNKFGMNVEGSYIVRMPRGWTIFTSKGELRNVARVLCGVKPDLVYSPFALLYEKIRTSFLAGKLTLYVYNFESYCILMIFKDLEMKYGVFASTDAQVNALDLDSAYKLDTVDISDIDNFILKEEEFKFENFQELSAEGTQNEFEDLEEIAETDVKNEKKDVEWSVTQAGKFDILRKDVRNAIKDYYSNPLFENIDFIDEVRIFDASGYVDEQFCKDLSDELLVEVKFTPTDLRSDMCKIVRRELEL